MRHEIEVINGLYCVFRDGRIIAAYETLKEAKDAVRRRYELKHRKEQSNGR